MLKLSANVKHLLRISRHKANGIAAAYHTEDGVYGYRPQCWKKTVSLPESEEAVRCRNQNCNLHRLVSAYREHGHKKANVDPLGLQKPSLPEELQPAAYGLSLESSEAYDMTGIWNIAKPRCSLPEVIDTLEQVYCGPLSVEFQHLEVMEERKWFGEAFEEISQQSLTPEEKIDVAKLMLRSQAFELFMQSKYTTVKRYGGEGAESAMGFYEELFKISAKENVQDVVIATAHRGRLNLLTSLLKFPAALMFLKMEGKREFPPDVAGSGDVLSHFTSSVDLQYGDNRVHVTMVPNPSHLEATNPVSVGKTRARQQSNRAGDYAPEEAHGTVGDGGMCLQVHGDGAFSGQGVIAETFALANVPHFTIGGSVHLIVNNQLGYTTGADKSRSSMYCSDVAKMTACPVIRVNSDYPEEVIKACRLAMAYRQRFRKDVLVDYNCYRRRGHNELDEAAFTQPLMYDIITNRRSTPDLYADKVVEEGLCSREELNQNVAAWNAVLTQNMHDVKDYVPKANHLEKQWSGFVQPKSSVSTWDTGVPSDVLKYVGAKSVTVPDNFRAHSTLDKTHIKRRLEKLQEGTKLDWSTFETLAFGSLLYQGFNVRLSGQDVGRGTFSHRHVMLVDQDTDSAYVPLNNILPNQRGFLEVSNSILSEEAVLGFEYGVSIENPRILPIWEAQFGDFVNGAQIMVDTYVTGGETKWLLQSGLVLLLPHGLDGPGPEHASCKIERFLQLCDSKEDGIDGDDRNIQITNPTTPAQYFHLLRRQMVRNFRKPLIIAAPKVLLRSPDTVSDLDDIRPGTSFQPVLGDPQADPTKVKTVMFVSGKHYYTLRNNRGSRDDVAIIRLEALCPFPAGELQKELKKYPAAKDFLWCQEEHRNHGPWTFVSTRFQNLVGKQLLYMGRDVHATPATGVGVVHKHEAEEIVRAAFAAR